MHIREALRDRNVLTICELLTPPSNNNAEEMLAAEKVAATRFKVYLAFTSWTYILFINLVILTHIGLAFLVRFFLYWNSIGVYC